MKKNIKNNKPKFVTEVTTIVPRGFFSELPKSKDSLIVNFIGHQTRSGGSNTLHTCCSILLTKQMTKDMHELLTNVLDDFEK